MGSEQENEMTVFTGFDYLVRAAMANTDRKREQEIRQEAAAEEQRRHARRAGRRSR